MMERLFLGISLGFNTSACLLSPTQGVLFAISEERLNGEKNTKKFPVNAINACIKFADENIQGGYYIDSVSVASYQNITKDWIEKYFDEETKHKVDFLEIYDSSETGLDYIAQLIKYFCGLTVYKDVIRVDHHTAHANSAICFHGIPRRLAALVTFDGFGDGISGRIKLSNGEVLSNVGVGSSIGLVYQFTTGALGYKEHYHEGKITGLAAYGDPIHAKTFRDMFEGTIKIDSGILPTIDERLYADSHIEDFEGFLALREEIYSTVGELLTGGARPEDIACSVQKFTENIITEWIECELSRYFGGTIPMMDVYLAGGLFANVKLNQRIHELSFVDSIFVAPPMGDEGTCIGAAYETMKNTMGFDTLIDNGLFLGKISANLGTRQDLSYSKAISLVEDKNKVRVRQLSHSGERATWIAQKLGEGKIVCLFQGRMEFGPRALCNRSILYKCDDPSVNKWLNDQLSRTEFMPFAPVCLRNDSYDLFKNLLGVTQTAEYMTATVDCTDEFKENYPAACHIDGTARPQLVTVDNNPFMFMLLTAYKELTGKKVLINTSFNLHNNPIIESVNVAYDSWLVSGTDILVIEDIIFERTDKDVR